MEETYTHYRARILLPEPLRRQAENVALLIGERLCDPLLVTALVELASRQIAIQSIQPTPLLPQYQIQIFHDCMFTMQHFARCFPQQPWEHMAHSYLSLLAKETRTTAINTVGVFEGVSGIAMSVSSLYPHYQELCTSLNARLCEQVHALFSLKPGKESLSLQDYDCVSGASGILAYLITVHTPDEAIVNTITLLLKRLVFLAMDIATTDTKKDLITSPPGYIGKFKCSTDRRNYELGMAHGISGPLAALSLAWTAGYHYPGQQEAINSLSQVLLQYRDHDTWGVTWPKYASLKTTTQSESHDAMFFATWSHGIPGIARALWHAGNAIDNLDLHRVAIAAIEAALRKTMETMSGYATLYNGTAGLLETCLRFVRETDAKHIENYIPQLVSCILDTFNPEWPVGFRHNHLGYGASDPVGFLKGASGIALALLSAATTVEPDWDHRMLIA
jgi:lantibiotic modifying enzyme